jgi:hypothetical protein
MKMRLMGLFLLFFTLASAHAQVPSLVNYQGRLINGTNLVNASVTVDFYLYTNSVGGSLVYLETDAGVAVVDGLYSTFLGDNPTIGVFADALTNAPLYVEVRINGATMCPRERIASVSYAITAGGVTNGAVSTSMMADGAVTGPKIAANAVTSVQIAAGAVSNSDLGASAVTYDKILDGTIKAADLDDLAAWKPTGNSGLTAGTHFIGTIGSSPLDLRANNQRILRLDGAGTSPNVIGGYSANTVTPSTVIGATIGGGGASGSPNTIAGNYATIGGGQDNTLRSEYSVIGGGRQNEIGTGSVSGVIGGGWNNEIQSNTLRATIGGGQNNLIESFSYGATLAGGYQNAIRSGSLSAAIGGGYLNEIRDGSSGSTIAGGETNTIDGNADLAFIGGGEANFIGADSSGAVIGGGMTNRVGSSSRDAVIVGGNFNRIGTNANYSIMGSGFGNVIGDNSWYGNVLGGYHNTIGTNADYSTIGGGQENLVDAQGATIAGGGKLDTLIQGNQALGSGAFIGGGAGNWIGVWSYGAVVGGGEQNRIASNSPYAMIGGGIINRIGIDAVYATIGGGLGNNICAGATNAIIVGGYMNTIGTNTPYATIGGGAGNTNSSEHAVIGGGRLNMIHTNADYSLIGGGQENVVGPNARNATVGGGWGNRAYGVGAVVAGGGRTVDSWSHNDASGEASTIGGGLGNITGSNAMFGVIAGGYNNTVNGGAGAVPGGSWNNASGNYSLAAGFRAHALHDGSFAWADSQDVDFSSTTNDEFAIRATNGVRIARNAGEDRAVPFGVRYGDNSVVAWAKVNENGSLQNGFNVAISTNRAMGSYEIQLRSPSGSSTELEPFACVELDSQPTNATMVRFISTDQRGLTNFYVYINNGSFAPTNDEFMVVVFGR